MVLTQSKFIVVSTSVLRFQSVKRHFLKRSIVNSLKEKKERIYKLFL